MSSLDQYAVVGHPIKHSKSPDLHAAFAKACDQAMTYTAKEIMPGHFDEEVKSFFQQGGKGLNVTVPFKEDAYQFADSLTTRAKQAGAVNTLIKNEDGSITGDNTDGIGLVTDITQNLGWRLKNSRVLILGAGGAVRGILGPFIDAGVSSITIANRTISKAEALVTLFSESQVSLSACGFEDVTGHFDLIINGTSASLSGDLPPIADAVIQADTHCYDMMYSKDLTPFLEWANTLGAKKISDGLGMLVCQGAESFYQWRNCHPETQSVIQQLRTSLK